MKATKGLKFCFITVAKKLFHIYPNAVATDANGITEESIPPEQTHHNDGRFDFGDGGLNSLIGICFGFRDIKQYLICFRF